MSCNYELFSLPPYKRNLTTSTLQSNARKQIWKILVHLHVKLITVFLTQYTIVSRPMSEQFALTYSFSGIVDPSFFHSLLLHFQTHAFYFLFRALSWHCILLRKIQVRKLFLLNDLYVMLQYIVLCC